jgi:hypothetical protein
MAVLNKMGYMICDADLSLRIKDPDSKETFLSTSEGTIEVTEGCFTKVTVLPDYTSSYQTTGIGDYSLELTAETGDGQFTINDSFSVDPDSSFYVRRSGPTRIYPLAEYEMNLEITANKDVRRFEESVPSDFVITDLGGGRLEEPEVGRVAKIIWDHDLKAGDKVNVSYKFDAPDISPALFLVGPLRVGEWEESRQWQIASDDTSGSLVPQADGGVSGAGWLDTGGSNACETGGVDCYTEVDDSPGSPDDGTTYIQKGTENGIEITFDIDVSSLADNSTITAIAVFFRCCGLAVNNASNMQAVYQVDGLGTTASGVSYACPKNSAWAETTQNFTILSITKTSGTDLEVGLQSAQNKLAGATQIYATLTYDPPASGPTTDQVLRHGNWFDSGSEQGFYWAD